MSVEDAIKRGGLRMVVVGGVPSPWGEAAKGILHIKGIDWVAVRLAYDSEPLKEWAGQRTGPVRILLGQCHAIDTYVPVADPLGDLHGSLADRSGQAGVGLERTNHRRLVQATGVQ